jgi:hypothetical protein
MLTVSSRLPHAFQLILTNRCHMNAIAAVEISVTYYSEHLHLVGPRLVWDINMRVRLSELFADDPPLIAPFAATLVTCDGRVERDTRKDVSHWPSWIGDTLVATRSLKPDPDAIARYLHTSEKLASKAKGIVRLYAGEAASLAPIEPSADWHLTFRDIASHSALPCSKSFEYQFQAAYELQDVSSMVVVGRVRLSCRVALQPASVTTSWYVEPNSSTDSRGRSMGA